MNLIRGGHVETLESGSAAPNQVRLSFNTRMFTGLVREVGTVASMVDGRLTIEAPETARGAHLGDSIAIDGVCLTVGAQEDSSLGFDAVPETLARTALGTLDHGSRVNLEPALRA